MDRILCERRGEATRRSPSDFGRGVMAAFEHSDCPYSGAHSAFRTAGIRPTGWLRNAHGQRLLSRNDDLAEVATADRARTSRRREVADQSAP